MPRKSHLTLRDSKSDENNKSNEELRSLPRVVDNERPKRRKNKLLKNTTLHECVEDCRKSNEINAVRSNNSSTLSVKDGVERIDVGEWNGEKESKKSAVEIKNRDVIREKTGVFQNKNGKLRSVIEVKRSDASAGRKPRVLKKRMARRPAKQESSERSENDNSLSGRKDVNDTPVKRNDNNDTCGNDRGHRSDGQLKNRKSKPKERNAANRVVVINGSRKTDRQFSSRRLSKSRNVREKTIGTKHCNKTTMNVIINEEAKRTKSDSASGTKCEYEKSSVDGRKQLNIIDYNDLDKIYDWDSYSDNDQKNTSSASNETENSRRNEHSSKNARSIVESSENPKIANDMQTAFGSDIILDINLNRLSSDLTFINAKHNILSQDNNKRNMVLTRNCNDQNYFETTNNNLQSLLCNEKHKSKDDMPEYDLKCMENNKMDFTNINWTTLINSNKNYEELNKYQNIENKELRSHSNDNVQANNIANYNRFIAHFDKIWEDVIREISGY